MESIYATYDYEQWLAGSTESARIAVPLLLDAIPARSVVDVGCGLGQWLIVFKEHGVEDVRGYDGPWIDRSRLLVAPGEFAGHDLREPLAVDRRFGLAICLEVVHVLEPEHAEPTIRALTELADVVVFSAGIPGQGGSTQLNEQWPAYWVELFGRFGYVASDPFRTRLWNEPDLKWWFAQNMLAYAKPETMEQLPVLAAARTDEPLPLVHPGCFAHALGELEAARATAAPRRRWLRRST
ncbi:MAG TPA: methyltransferase domain-containing protein [Gaiellaceae bacterium]|nr:methyltransferase domain-containing protein [Gaiellaceae bacterium]